MDAGLQILQTQVVGGWASWRGWEDWEDEGGRVRQKIGEWVMGRTDAPHPVSLLVLLPAGIGPKIV